MTLTAGGELAEAGKPCSLHHWRLETALMEAMSHCDALVQNITNLFKFSNAVAF